MCRKNEIHEGGVEIINFQVFVFIRRWLGVATFFLICKKNPKILTYIWSYVKKNDIFLHIYIYDTHIHIFMSLWVFGYIILLKIITYI